MEFWMGMAPTLVLVDCFCSDHFRSKQDAHFIFTGEAMQGTRKQNLVSNLITLLITFNPNSHFTTGPFTWVLNQLWWWQDSVTGVWGPRSYYCTCQQKPLTCTPYDVLEVTFSF